jgi:hypothetical protein
LRHLYPLFTTIGRHCKRVKRRSGGKCFEFQAISDETAAKNGLFEGDFLKQKPRKTGP